MKLKQANTYTIQCMGQGISLKSDLNHDLTFYCHSIRSMFRVLGMYNFGLEKNTMSFHPFEGIIFIMI